ncbi:MAG: hypothetical protein N2746_10535 [Deltaproteobacteria bacterium]|nr:hypothetical protein [Deltaproteobacteria bacterium]
MKFTVYVSLTILFITVGCVPQNEIIYHDIYVAKDVMDYDEILLDYGNDIGSHASTTRPLFVIEETKRNLPFPSDFFTVEDKFCTSGKRINLSNINNEPLDLGLVFLGDQYLQAINKMCGFATFGPIIIPFLGKIDISPYENAIDNFESLPILLYKGGQEPVIVPISIKFVEKYIETSRRLLRYLWIRPLRPLEEDSKYYYFVLNSLRDSKGNRIIRDRGFERVINERYNLTGEEQRLGVLVNEAIEFLLGLRSDIRKDDIAMAMSFTTNKVRSVYKNVRDFLYSENLPFNLSFDVDDDGMDDIGNATNYKGRDYSSIEGLKYIVEGKFDAPSFIDKKGRIVFKNSDTPVMQKIEKIGFTLFIPNGSQPHKIAMFQHGLSAQRWDMRGIADIFLKENIAFIAIDAVTHGSRTADPSRSGFQFLNINDPLATRSNFMQTHFDHLRLVQFVKSLEGFDRLPYGADGIPDFDVSRFFYVGNSLGAILGGVTISIEDLLELAVLNVGGGGMMDFVQSFLLQAAPSLAEMPEVPLFSAVAQNILDGIDPSVHSIYTSSKKYILLQEACEDFTVPNATTEGLARALRIPLVRPVFEKVPFVEIVDEPYTGSGLTQFHPADHSFLFYRSGEKAAEGERGRKQIIHFCKAYLESGKGEIRSFWNE